MKSGNSICEKIIDPFHRYKIYISAMIISGDLSCEKMIDPFHRLRIWISAMIMKILSETFAYLLSWKGGVLLWFNDAIYVNQGLSRSGSWVLFLEYCNIITTSWNKNITTSLAL